MIKQSPVSTTSSVTVAVRARPFLARDEGQKNVVRVISPSKEDENPTVVLDVLTTQLASSPRVEPKYFAFDHCFDAKATQTDLFSTIGTKIVDNALEGYNACIFAYGQTGSGKSYSIIGPQDDEGLIPRVTRSLPWDSDDSRVTVSFLEIYNEQLRDLLNPTVRKKPLYVHQHPKLGVYVPHLTEAPVTNHQEAMSRLDFGSKIRATAQTSMNSQSSRSHSLFIIRMTRTVEKVIYSSTINLIDLAGSERVKKAGHHRGGRMLESSNINSSLSVLGLVISKLASHESQKKNQHVPFRQSKLTYLLQDALSGNSKTWMLANISPAQSETEETLSTLRFAQSVKKVKVTAYSNQHDEAETDLMLQTMMTEIEELRTELHSNHNPSSPKAGRLRREVEAMESLNAMVSSKYDRRGWDDARRREEEQELMRQEVLANLRVGRMLGMACDHPYILNISDDVALTGRLLYVLDEDLIKVGSALKNQIRLLGLGIGSLLCIIKKEHSGPDQKIKLRKQERGGRLVINGNEIDEGTTVELRHGDRLLFGRAFAFRLVLPGMPNVHPTSDAQFASVLADSNYHPPGDSKIQHAIALNRELSRRQLTEEQTAKFMEKLQKLQNDVDESNELIKELLGDAGPQLSVGLLSSYSITGTDSEPELVVQQRDAAPPEEDDEGTSSENAAAAAAGGGSSSSGNSSSSGDKERPLVAVWLQSAFYCRLDIMRDLYQQHLEKVRNAGDDDKSVEDGVHGGISIGGGAYGDGDGGGIGIEGGGGIERIESGGDGKSNPLNQIHEAWGSMGEDAEDFGNGGGKEQEPESHLHATNVWAPEEIGNMTTATNIAMA